MARKINRVGIPEEKKIQEFCEIPEEQIIPPAEDIVTETQTKVMIVETGKIPYSSDDSVLYKVQVIHPSLRRRAEPNTNAEVLGLITDKGIYDIYKEEFAWGQLKDKSWIMLQFCHKIKE